eukprot:4948880-Pyramimonas_sp.AAC.1
MSASRDIAPIARARLATGRYGHFVTDAAIGPLRYVRNLAEEVGPAEPSPAAPDDPVAAEADVEHSDDPMAPGT